MIRTIAVAAGMMLTSMAAYAEPVRPVRPLEGYACMKLAVSEAQALNPNGTGINLVEQPAPGAAVVTTAPATVFVRTPLVKSNGFLQALALNGKPAWVAADKVRPLDGLSRCTPSVMSNGRLGVG